MRPLAVIACAICAVAALGLSIMTYMDVFMFGFPDGHVTDYQRATGPPLRVLTWVAAGLSLMFLALAVSPIGTRVRTFGWLGLVLALALVAIGTQIAIPWYFGTHLGLDNGIGG